MPIRPIDYYVMAPKTLEGTQIKHAENTKANLDQLNLTQQMENQIRQNSMQTTALEKSVYYENKYDAKEKGKNEYSNPFQKQKKKARSGEEESSQEGAYRNGFDIKI